MRILRRFVIALILTASLGAPAFADHARHRDRSDRDSAERRHPRPGQGDRYRERRGYRPYRPYYRYQRPYRHYYSPRYDYTCRVWISGYWDYNEYGEYYVRGHYGYVICR